MESKTPLTQMQALVSHWSTLMVSTRPTKRGREDDTSQGRAIRSRTVPDAHVVSERRWQSETQSVPVLSDIGSTQNNA